MLNYVLHIHSDLSPDPELTYLSVDSVERACELANREFERSGHYSKIEVRQANKMLFLLLRRALAETAISESPLTPRQIQ